MNRRTFFSALGGICLLTACEHKELCYSHPHFATIWIEFDWNEIGSHGRPEGMRVAFYSEKGGEPLEFDCPTEGRYRVELPFEVYRVLCYNNDYDGIEWKDESWYDRMAVCTEGRKTPDGVQAYLTPDWLCGGMLAGGLDLSRVQPGDEKTVVFIPRRMTGVYTFEVRGVRFLERAAGLRGPLSGMGVELPMAADRLPEGVSGCLLFGGKVEGDLLTGGFYTFGPVPAEHLFTLYIQDKNGGLHLLSEDVGGQIAGVPLERGHVHDVHLVLHFDYAVPGPSSDGSGFDPSVGDWEDVNEVIPV